MRGLIKLETYSFWLLPPKPGKHKTIGLLSSARGLPPN